MTDPTGPSPTDPSGLDPGGVEQRGPGGYVRRTERRSARRRDERRSRSDRPGRGMLAALVAIVVVVAVAVLWSPLVPEVGHGLPAQGGASTTAATTASTVPSAPAPGSALLVVKQDGKVTFVALFYAGPKGGIVLGMPGITLLRSGARFVPLAQAYSPESPAALATPVADALAVPPGAVASIEWRELRTILAGAAGDVKLPEGLDPRGADAGGVSAVLAATLGRGEATGGAAGPWWEQAAIEGEADGFHSAMAAALASAAGRAWVGQVLTGTLVEYGAGETYLEPDLQAAKGVLSGTGGAS
jgi:hypothetical protein